VSELEGDPAELPLRDAQGPGGDGPQDTAGGPPGLTVLQPGAGKAAELGGFGIAWKLWGEQTNGSVSVVEHTFAVGVLVPPHVHTREDEYSIVTEGEIGFRSGDREVVLAAGGYITKPRGELHAMWNAGQAPARMIEIISPAGFEHYFREVADLVSAAPIEPGRAATIAARFGLGFEQPDWLGDVIERYGLQPPPAR
jgi:quercetin dioxygenase-like cupin family protein